MRISDWSSDVCSSDLKQHNPRAGLVQMHRTQNDRVLDFIEQDQITQLIHSKPGLTFNPDGSLSQTPANVAAMGRHYFDRPPPTYAQPGQRPVGLGEHRDLAERTSKRLNPSH